MLVVLGKLASFLVPILMIGFWIWMCVDCYRRYGFHYWLIFFFLFPISTLIYFIIHAQLILSGMGSSGGSGPFGLGLGSQIREAQQNVRMADTVAARSELGELYFAAGKYTESENEYRQVLERDSDNVDALYYLGICRMAQKDHAGGIEFLKRLVEVNKEYRFGKAWHRYAECLEAVGRKDEALEQRRKLCRAFPRPLTEFAYAMSLADAGQRDKAREVLDEMISTANMAPKEDGVWIEQGKRMLSSLG